MTTTREKLIDLINTARFDIEGICDEQPFCGGCPAAVHESKCKAGYIADHLIAKGVTVQEDCKACAEATTNCIAKLQEQIAELRSMQEWVSVKDRLPESGKEAVLIALRWCEVDIGWCEDEKWGSEFVNEYEDGEVTHWMPLPQPPKGE